MNAIVFPSGDHLGTPICIPGFATTSVIAPEVASILYKPARYQLSSPFPCAAVITRRLLSGAQSNSYTYISSGEICRTLAASESTKVSLCSRNSSETTPSSGVSATNGPAARVAFSVKSSATVFPSGDQPGLAKKPFRCVNCFASPPEAFATKS